jgi:SmpA / OmlA family
VSEAERYFLRSFWLNSAQALGLLAVSVGLLKITFARFRARSPTGAGGRPTLTVAATMLLVAWAGVILAVVQWLHVNFATVYAPSYREDRFAQVRIGMTRQEVESLLGPPLRKTPLPSESWKPDDCWVYSRPPGSGLLGDNYWRRWIFFGPTKDSRVEAIVNDYYED